MKAHLYCFFENETPFCSILFNHTVLMFLLVTDIYPCLVLHDYVDKK